MNISECISSIIQQYGINAMTIPFKDIKGEPISPEVWITNIFSTTTIPIYSQFKPWERELICHTRDLQIVDNRRGIYLLPKLLTTTPIMYVIDVHPPLDGRRGTYGDISPTYGISRGASGVVTAMAYMQLVSQMRSEPTFQYLGQNKIKLYGFPPGMLRFVLAARHDPNGESIPESCRDSFMQLAELDVKMNLYNNLKHYDNLPTAFGQINLRIEDFQSAESDRKTMLDEWENVFHLDSVDLFQFL